MKLSFATLFAALFLLAVADSSSALPTPCGSTGLLSQPTAQTLNSGNICVGLWSDYSEWGKTPATEYDATIMPFSMTLGLGSFMEAYGSFPNLLFNDDETASGRGYSTLGVKLRLLGKRTSPVKLAIDGQFRRAVSMDPDIDGMTDFLGRGILSLNTRRFGLHGWGGILDKDENIAAGIGPFEDITGYGGGIEIFPIDRLRIIAEAEIYEEDLPTPVEVGEWMAGFQYFLSPHLTLNVGYGGPLEGDDIGLSPETRILVGLSTCQGIGSYSQVQMKAPLEEETSTEKTKEPVKTLRIKALSPLLTSPDQLEDTPADVPIMPEEKGMPETVSEPPAAPAIPVVPLPSLLEAAPASTAVEIPVDEMQEVVLDPSQNIKKTDAYKEEISRQSQSPVGPPAMASIERAPIGTGGKARVYRRFILPEFSFKVDQYSLTPEGSAALSMIAVELSKDENWFALRIDGHTDSTGSERYNDQLSDSRAIEYAMHLVANNGIDPDRVFYKGLGESSPIAENTTQEGRAQNRRVELLVLVPDQ